MRGYHVSVDSPMTIFTIATLSGFSGLKASKQTNNIQNWKGIWGRDGEGEEEKEGVFD